MSTRKHPKRDEFDMERGPWMDDLPRNYASIIRHYRPDLPKRRIYDVRHGNIVDMEILSELKRVARESKYAKQLVAA